MFLKKMKKEGERWREKKEILNQRWKKVSLKDIKRVRTKENEKSMGSEFQKEKDNGCIMNE